MVLLVLTAVLTARAGAQSGAAASQPSAASPAADYESLFAQAQSHYEAHRYAQAWALFMQAHELDPGADTLRGLGMTELELHNYADSIQHLQAALSSTVRPLSDALRASAQSLLASARGAVARFELRLVPEPSQLRVLVDGMPVDLPADQTLTLPIGEHVLQVQAPDCQEVKRTLRVKGGEVQRLVIELSRRLPPSAAASAAPKLATTAAPAEEAPHTLWSSPWFWAVVDAAVVGSVLTTVL
ncbi:MAG TPA: hypothetical protein VF331_11455, partial [Polyangiales bacterium]